MPSPECLSLAWFPADQMLQVGEVYEFTAVCNNAAHYASVKVSYQGTGPLLVPFAADPPGSSVVFKVEPPQGCQGVVIHGYCKADPGDVTVVCEDAWNFSVQ